VPPQPKGYEKQRSARHPGFPSNYVLAMMERGWDWRGEQVEASCQNQAIYQVETSRSGGEQAQRAMLWQPSNEDTWLQVRRPGLFLGHCCFIAEALVWTSISLTKENKK